MKSLDWGFFYAWILLQKLMIWEQSQARFFKSWKWMFSRLKFQNTQNQLFKKSKYPKKSSHCNIELIFFCNLVTFLSQNLLRPNILIFWITMQKVFGRRTSEKRV